MKKSNGNKNLAREKFNQIVQKHIIDYIVHKEIPEDRSQEEIKHTEIFPEHRGKLHPTDPGVDDYRKELVKLIEEELYNYYEFFIREELKHVDRFFKIAIVDLVGKRTTELDQSLDRILSCYNNLENYDQVIAYGDRLLGLKNDDARVYNAIGNAYYNKQDYDKAIESYKRSLELKPGDEYYKEKLSKAQAKKAESDNQES